VLGRFFRWIGSGRAAGKLRRRPRTTADANECAELLLDAARLYDGPTVHLEAAVALAEANRVEERAICWRRAVELKLLLLPTDAQLAALASVLRQTAGDVLASLTSRDRKLLGQHWKPEWRGSFDGEERWRLEQERSVHAIQYTRAGILR
jgi:hypothetical protein